MNYYSILGLPFDATQEEIRDAHLDAVRHYHPDINPDPAGQEEFLKIQQAYEVLSNPDSRKNYDRTLSQEDRKIPVELELTYSRSFFTQIQRTSAPLCVDEFTQCNDSNKRGNVYPAYLSGN